MSTLITFVPGTSVLHRLPAGAKVAGLVVISTAALVLASAWQTAALLGLALLSYVVAGLPRYVLMRQTRSLLPLMLVLGAYQVLVQGGVAAFRIVGDLVGIFLVAAVVSLTTRATAMLDLAVWLVGPLRVVGVQPERFGVALALGMRSVPLVLDLAGEVRAAQEARGLRFSLRAFAVPLVVRSLRQADGLAEALIARGFDD